MRTLQIWYLTELVITFEGQEVNNTHLLAKKNGMGRTLGKRNLQYRWEAHAQDSDLKPS